MYARFLLSTMKDCLRGLLRDYGLKWAWRAWKRESGVLWRKAGWIAVFAECLKAVNI